MTQGTAERETVLVVEDEDHLAELYTEYLQSDYEVRTAYGGLEAMEMLASDLDVVLLDRRMPIVSGNEVLAEIEERGLQCRVAMVTAVDPDFDIIDMGCDDYVVKPVTRDRLTEVVDRLLKLSAYTDRKRELTSKKLKRNVLQVEKTESELADSDTFQRLQREIDEMEDTIQGIADDLGDDYVAENR
ncbi:response regulator [Halosimplex litoreum]|uniref:Response regulator n=1 Tax=Halosimplex litoreum TaxID=1198301 RepID=A0A7T3KVD7_9EURY|nr:response regulator [Halosimplex litoreum]QPV63039.1 response regulator [Halosimplex litoreum]